jgi:hypothetical protein
MNTFAGDSMGWSAGWFNDWWTQDRGTIGINWWATRRWRVGFDYGLINLDRGGFNGRTYAFHTRFQWVY